IGGILIADYYFIRKQKLHVNELYKENGHYTFGNGFNMSAIIALLLGIVPNVPGFLTTVKIISQESVPFWISNLYHYAWFVGFLVSGVTYLIMMRKDKISIDDFNNIKQEGSEYVTAH
ncbi:MAG: cytosine permease, partial [Chitinophagales bacterium]